MASDTPTVRSRRDWPFLSDVARQVASSHEIWPIPRSARLVPRRSARPSYLRPRNWPHRLRRTVVALSQGNWPTGRSAA